MVDADVVLEGVVIVVVGLLVVVDDVVDVETVSVISVYCSDVPEIV